MSGKRPRGEAQQFFITKVYDKKTPESKLLKQIKKDLKEVTKTDM